MISKIITKTKNYVGKLQSKMQQHSQNNEQQQVQSNPDGQTKGKTYGVIYEIFADGKPAQGNSGIANKRKEWEQGDII